MGVKYMNKSQNKRQLCSSNNLEKVPLGNMYHFYRLETPKFAEVV